MSPQVMSALNGETLHKKLPLFGLLAPSGREMLAPTSPSLPSRVLPPLNACIAAVPEQVMSEFVASTSMTSTCRATVAFVPSPRGADASIVAEPATLPATTSTVAAAR